MMNKTASFVPGLTLCLFFVLCMSTRAFCAREGGGGSADNFHNEDEINLYCLKKSYPQIVSMIQEPDGKWLIMRNGKKILYSAAAPRTPASALNVDVAESMKQPYPLEPDRPETPPGVSPGRKRSYALFEALYGENREEVTRALRPVRLGKGFVMLGPEAAKALEGATRKLEDIRLANPGMEKWLNPDGGFNWRMIAGEDARSAHSYGIAFDIGAKHAPYWRWSGRMPHPMQKTYPEAIARALEDQGFIWGGKWHEYDLMHFEYRPELICKARIMAGKAHMNNN